MQSWCQKPSQSSHRALVSDLDQNHPPAFRQPVDLRVNGKAGQQLYRLLRLQPRPWLQRVSCKTISKNYILLFKNQVSSRSEAKSQPDLSLSLGGGEIREIKYTKGTLNYACKENCPHCGISWSWAISSKWWLCCSELSCLLQRASRSQSVLPLLATAEQFGVPVLQSPWKVMQIKKENAP